MIRPSLKRLGAAATRLFYLVAASALLVALLTTFEHVGPGSSTAHSPERTSDFFNSIFPSRQCPARLRSESGAPRGMKTVGASRAVYSSSRFPSPGSTLVIMRCRLSAW